VPYQSQNPGMIARLILNQGMAGEEGRLRSGQLWGQTISNIGQNIAGSLSGFLQQRGENQEYQAEAPARARKAETEELTLRGLRREDTDALDAKETASTRLGAQRRVAEWDKNNQEPPPFNLVLEAFGIEGAKTYIDAQQAADELVTGRVENTEAALGRAARAVLLVEDPAQQAKVWWEFYDGLIGAGIVPPDPPGTERQYDPAKTQALAARADMTPEAPEGPGTRSVQTMKDGVPVTSIVPDVPGMSYPSQPQTPQSPAQMKRWKTPEGNFIEAAEWPGPGYEPWDTRVSPPGYNPSVMPTGWMNVIDRAVGSMPANRRAPLMARMNRLASEGNWEELKGATIQMAVESENVDTKNQVLGRMMTLAAMTDVQSMLHELKDKGIPTNWFVGKMEDFERKLGMSSNTEYVRLGNRLHDLLVAYRRAATGVAFSARESADYARMFPNYSNELPVNLALIDGLVRSIEGHNKTYWEYKLGPEGARLVGVLGEEKDDDAGPSEWFERYQQRGATPPGS